MMNTHGVIYIMITSGTLIITATKLIFHKENSRDFIWIFHSHSHITSMHTHLLFTSLGYFREIQYMCVLVYSSTCIPVICLPAWMSEHMYAEIHEYIGHLHVHDVPQYFSVEEEIDLMYL